MVIPVLQSTVTASKFRGCLLGALLGDCFGAPYEGEVGVSKVVLQKYFDKLEEPNFRAPYKRYTDDTAMTKSVVESLIQHGSFNDKDMAKRFVTEYFQDPNRGYGATVDRVFRKLRETKFEDVYKAASEQFEGQGSAGNGAAMRVAPVALFCNRDDDLLVETAAKTSRLTHSHRMGVNGAILQALAVQQSFYENPKTPVDVEKFSKTLLEKMIKVEEASSDDLPSEDNVTYETQLKNVQNLLKKDDVGDEEVVDKLGHNVFALYSVPTAIYCFLRSQKPIDNIQTENPFRRAIQYSISLGGDTDTIASMAGAISGAHLGGEAINENFLKHCESAETIKQLAEELHSVTYI